MAYVSLGLDFGMVDVGPEIVTIGTDDGGAANNVTLCINKGITGITRLEVHKLVEAILRRLDDGRYDDTLSI